VLLRFALSVLFGADALARNGFRELFETVFFGIGQVLLFVLRVSVDHVQDAAGDVVVKDRANTAALAATTHGPDFPLAKSALRHPPVCGITG
jgi:hypothetical protein